MNLRESRMALGKTVADVSEELEVTAATISGWECDRYFPSPERIPDVAKEYGVTPMELAQHIQRVRAEKRAERIERRATAPKPTRRKQTAGR